MFARLTPTALGRWSAARPRRALGVWLGFVVVCVALGAATGTKTLDNGAVGESARGYALMNRFDLWPPGRELAYLHSSTLRANEVSFEAAVGDVRRRLLALGFRLGQKTSADEHSVVVIATFAHFVPLARIESAISTTQREHPSLTVEETGDLSTSAARTKIVNGDLRHVELLAIGVTLLVLLFAFGALAAALVPVLLGLTAVIAGLGLLGPLSQVFSVQDSAKTVVLLIGLAVGVDYALFYVIRAREERHRGAPSQVALAQTARTSGRTVVVSGATVTVAMAGLFLSGASVMSGIAAGTIAVIGCSVLGSITVLPAVLSLLGPHIDAGRIPRMPRIVGDGESRFWSALARRVTTHPWLVAE